MTTAIAASSAYIVNEWYFKIAINPPPQNYKQVCNVSHNILGIHFDHKVDESSHPRTCV